jgi:hypothetical protein
MFRSGEGCQARLSWLMAINGESGKIMSVPDREVTN